MSLFGLVVLYILFRLVVPVLIKKARAPRTKTPRPVFTIPDDDEEEETVDRPQPKAPSKVYTTVSTEIPGEEGTGKDPLQVPNAPLTAVLTEAKPIFSKNDLRNGFIMAEILGKPKALMTPEEGKYPC